MVTNALLTQMTDNKLYDVINCGTSDKFPPWQLQPRLFLISIVDCKLNCTWKREEQKSLTQILSKSVWNEMTTEFNSAMRNSALCSLVELANQG